MPQCHKIAAVLASQQRDDCTHDIAEDLSANRPQLALNAPPPITPTTKACAFCGYQAARLLLCARCKLARYCHADHQRQHWYTFVYVLKKITEKYKAICIYLLSAQVHPQGSVRCTCAFRSQSDHVGRGCESQRGYAALPGGAGGKSAKRQENCGYA